MGRGWPSRRILGLIALAGMVASVSVGLLWAGERSGRAAAAPQKAAAAPAAGDVEITAPETGAKLRGVALVQVTWPERSGYLIFRVDGNFAYATVAPYQMRWDTSTTKDGPHVVRADAYDWMSDYVGSSSVQVMIENSIPTPGDGVLLTVRFGEQDASTRQVMARGEIAALRGDQMLPEGFDVLGGTLRAEISQTVLDAHYEGVSALVRNRLRAASLMAGGARRAVPEEGDYAMVQVSRNGLAVPVATSASRPRVGLGEISLALADYPLFPGDTWESPIGVVCDLYTRRGIYVQARHTFEGLRWFQGRECAVISSTYQVPGVPLLARVSGLQAASATGLGGAYGTELTAMRGGAGRRGGGGMRGGMMGGGGARGATGAGRQPGAAQAAPGGAARGPVTLDSARLVNLEGTRRTYVTRETGRVMFTEDTIRGKVEFRTVTGAATQASAGPAGGYTMALTAMRGGGGRRGGGGMRGGMMGGGGMRGAATRGAPGAARQPAGGPPTAGAGPAAEAARQIPSSLDYGLRLTTEFLVR